MNFRFTVVVMSAKLNYVLEAVFTVGGSHLATARRCQVDPSRKQRRGPGLQCKERRTCCASQSPLKASSTQSTALNSTVRTQPATTSSGVASYTFKKLSGALAHHQMQLGMKTNHVRSRDLHKTLSGLSQRKARLVAELNELKSNFDDGLFVKKPSAKERRQRQYSTLEEDLFAENTSAAGGRFLPRSSSEFIMGLSEENRILRTTST